MLPMLVTMAVAGFVSGPLTAYVPTKVQLLLGTITAALSCGGLTLFHSAYWQVAVATGVFGVGLGLTFTAMVNLIVHTVPAGQTAVASGMNANIRTIGGSLGAAVASAVITAHEPGGLPLEAGYTHGFLLSPPSRPSPSRSPCSSRAGGAASGAGSAPRRRRRRADGGAATDHGAPRHPAPLRSWRRSRTVT